MRERRIGRGVVAGLFVLLCVIVGCAASGNGARAEDDDLPEFSAARLGDNGSLADDALSPTEREAVKRSWATASPERKALDDPADDDPFAEKDEAKPDEPPKGPFGRAMDATGRFFVSVTSVAVTLGMMIAPIFLTMGV